MLTSQKDNNFIKINNSLFTKKYRTSTRKSFPDPKNSFRVSFPHSQKVEIVVDSDVEITDKTYPLREEATKLQQSMLEQSKILKNSRLAYNQLELKSQNLDSEAKKLLVERDKQKEMYTSLMKAKIDTKIVIDSQQRLMDKYIFITEQLNSRPSTGNRRPVTASGMRLNLARGHNIIT